ncbi:hypothetical protein, partial [Streptomyces sp. st77]|uniref:hypothetical protein n=1 Tax=Streptomyces sp. st77 TaxID=1828074 RepID=UPI001C54D65A
VWADRAVWVCGTGPGLLEYGSGPWCRWRTCPGTRPRPSDLVGAAGMAERFSGEVLPPGG